MQDLFQMCAGVDSAITQPGDFQSRLAARLDNENPFESTTQANQLACSGHIKIPCGIFIVQRSKGH